MIYSTITNYSPQRGPRDTPSKTSCSPARHQHIRKCPSRRRRSSDEYDTYTPQIALPASVETQIETQSKPYTAAVFFHFKMTGSLERHRAYHAAYDSDAFTVDFEADYESGDLTITVDRADES